MEALPEPDTIKDKLCAPVTNAAINETQDPTSVIAGSNIVISGPKIKLPILLKVAVWCKVTS